ncbi:MAG: choloylglycine hydrolase family protein [Ruminococcaceae bacterium]|nr:choloylglycine hydrolase family protein [Oscillospiraceae bacterium]
MCTAVSYRTNAHYFGRNLDLWYSYDEAVAVTPRNYPFGFRHMPMMDAHYAMIGMATVVEGYPLYYEATNEAGLSMAGLNFPGNAVYFPYAEGCDNVTPFEFIPWVLGQCENITEARAVLGRINLLGEDFSDELPLSPLHFMISDRDSTIVAESVAEGLRVYDDPVKILTNNPPFDYHMLNLGNYMNVTASEPVNRFSDELSLEPFSLGMGSIGLPGDMSSPSRFVRAAFVRHNSISDGTEDDSVSQFFHILGSVAQPRGCTATADEKYEYTLYSSCCNTDTGVYYYTTYDGIGINAVDMKRCDPYAGEVISYPIIRDMQVRWQN